MADRWGVPETRSVSDRLARSYRTLMQRLLSFGITPRYLDVRQVFVVGCGHSGTTITAAKLGNHPDAYMIGRETEAFFPLTGLHCARRLAEEWAYTAERLGCSLFLEKTPRHVHALDRIWRVLPEALVIGLVRNPLDTCLSLKNRFDSIEHGVDRWITDNSALAAALSSDQVTLVRYEDLVGNPVATFSDICTFLEIPWDDRILNEGTTAYSKTKQPGNMALREEQVRSPIYPNVGKWRSGLTLEEIDYVTRKTRRLALELGYDPDNPPAG